jgi:large repetitive protein
MPNYSGMWNLVQQLQAKAADNWPLAPAVPGAPTSVSASAGNTQATVSFTAPADTGVPAGITGYRVTSSPGAITATGASSPITVTGLTNGTSYTFTVAAQNATGYGPESSASNSVTPAEALFAATTYTGTGGAQTITNGINLSANGGFVWTKSRSNATNNMANDTVRGTSAYLQINTTGSQQTGAAGVNGYTTTGYTLDTSSEWNGAGRTFVSWTFRNRTGFFRAMTYASTGSNLTVNHSLGVAPELVIIKAMNWNIPGWWVGANFTPSTLDYAYLNLASNGGTTGYTNGQFTAAPTSTQMFLGTNGDVNTTISANYVAYLFASLPGVSKVGTYTGNGSSQTINCGFTAGARFFLVKSLNDTGDWWIWDSARGITAPADPALRANSSAVEVSSADATDPDNSGIIVNQESTCNINVNGATYIFLAVA